MSLRSICVFCGASRGTNPVYEQAAQDLGRTLAANGIRLVYGGGAVGLMGVVADATMAAGGEAGPVHSAALKVAGELTWPLVDLRVDWADEDPIGQLDALWQAYRPQMQDYVTRALDPTAAPSYGVPGDE